MDRVDQIVDGCHAAFFRDAGEMSVTGCCFGAGMAEEGLNVAKTQALLKQMGGITDIMPTAGLCRLIELRAELCRLRCNLSRHNQRFSKKAKSSSSGL